MEINNKNAILIENQAAEQITDIRLHALCLDWPFKSNVPLDSEIHWSDVLPTSSSTPLPLLLHAPVLLANKYILFFMGSWPVFSVTDGY